MTARVYFVGGPLDTTSRPLDGEIPTVYYHIEAAEIPGIYKAEESYEYEPVIKPGMIHVYQRVTKTPRSNSLIYEYSGRRG